MENQRMEKDYIVSWNEQIVCYANVKAKSKTKALEKAKEIGYKDLDIDLNIADNFEVNEK